MKNVFALLLCVALTACSLNVLTEADKVFISQTTAASLHTQSSVNFYFNAENYARMKDILVKCEKVVDLLNPQNSDYEKCQEYVDSAVQMMENVVNVESQKRTAQVI